MVCLATSGEVVLKTDKITGDIVEDLLGGDIDNIDDYYFHLYVDRVRWHDGVFLPNLEKFVDPQNNDRLDLYYQDDCFSYEYDSDLEEDYLYDAVYNHNELDVLIFKSLPRYNYLITSQYTDLYKCDICECVFCDYNGVYAEFKKKRKNDAIDVCHDCKANNLDKYKYGNFSYKHSKISRALKYYNGVAASKNQRYIAQLLGGEINKPISNFYADVFLHDKNIVIEYDGGGHFIPLYHNELTQDEFDEKERVRTEEILNHGYKLIRIVSLNDLLPTDNDLINAINLSISKLESQEIDIIEVNKDNFTHLRKIDSEKIVV